MDPWGSAAFIVFLLVALSGALTLDRRDEWIILDGLTRTYFMRPRWFAVGIAVLILLVVKSSFL
jgi:hypothetical protein